MNKTQPAIVIALAALVVLLAAVAIETSSGSTAQIEAVTKILADPIDDTTATTATTVAASGTEAGGDDRPALPAAIDGDGQSPEPSIGPDDTTTTTTDATNAEVAGSTPFGASSVYYNDFSSGTLGSEWEIYDGPGNAGWGLRRPSAISIVPGVGTVAGPNCLAITARMGTGADAGQLVSGGLKLRGVPRKYGRYTMRIRIDDDPDEVTSGVALLWPTNNIWPEGGEINIIENYYNRATRTPVESRLHWMDPDATPPFDRGDDRLNQVDLGVDGSDWHVYVLEWASDLVTIAVDGGPPIVMSGGGQAQIPQWNMDLTLQLDAFDAPNTGTQPVMNGEVSMCVDYVRVEPL